MTYSNICKHGLHFPDCLKCTARLENEIKEDNFVVMFILIAGAIIISLCIAYLYNIFLPV